MADVVGVHAKSLSVHGLEARDSTLEPSCRITGRISGCARRGVYSAHKALVTETGERTGRSPNDKYIVDEETTSDDINWGDVNVSTDLATFQKMRAKVVNYLSQQDDLFVQDLYCGADFSEALPIRVINQNAWHNAFARNMFIRPDAEQMKQHTPDFTVFHAPHFEADAASDELNSQCFVMVNYQAKEVIIGGTRYAGEIKKSIFSVMNLICQRKAYSQCIVQPILLVRIQQYFSVFQVLVKLPYRLIQNDF